MSSLTDILSMSYFYSLHFMYKFHPPVESVYWFHIVIIFLSHIIFPLLCRLDLEWIFYSTVNFIHWKLCWVWSVWTLIFTFCSQPRLGLLYQGRDFGEQIRFDRATRRSTTVYRGKTELPWGWQCATKILVGRDLKRYGTIYLNRILHAIRVYKGVRYVCKLYKNGCSPFCRYKYIYMYTYIAKYLCMK